MILHHCDAIEWVAVFAYLKKCKCYQCQVWSCTQLGSNNEAMNNIESIVMELKGKA